MLKHGILGLLNYGNMTGYEIMEVFRDSLAHFWTANTSQIYRELQTLKKKGFVDSREIAQTGKPDKKEFSITEEGKAELKRWLREDNLKCENVSVLMKTFFSANLGREENIRRMREAKAKLLECKAGLSVGKAVLEKYVEDMHAEEDGIYWRMTLDYGERQYQMLLEWYDHCIALLEGRK